MKDEFTVVEDILPEEIIDEDTPITEEIDIGDTTIIEVGGVEIASLDFVPTDGELIYSDDTAKYVGEFKYTIKRNPDEIITANGSIAFNIKSGYGVIVDAGENNNSLEVHLDEEVIKTFGKVDDFFFNGDSIIINKIGKLNISLDQDPNSSLVYYLIANDKTIGTINIPKDQFLKSVSPLSEDYKITFTWETSDGEQTTTIDFKSLVDVYKAGSGLELVEGTFSVKLDPNTNVALSVTESGLKLDLTALQTQVDELQQEVIKIDGIVAENNAEIQENTKEIAALREDLLNTAENLQTSISDIMDTALTTDTPQIVKKEGAKIFEKGFGISSEDGANVIDVNNYGTALSFLGADGKNIFYLNILDKTASAFNKKLVTEDELIAQHGTKVTINGQFQETFNADTKADKTDVDAIAQSLDNYVQTTKTSGADTAVIKNNGNTVSMGVQNQDSGSILGLSSNSLQLSISENEDESSIMMMPDHVDIDTKDLTWNGDTVVTKIDLKKKQDKLTAGTNITIDENNVISATGGDSSFDLSQLPNFTSTLKVDLSKSSALAGLLTYNIQSSSDFYVDWGDGTNTYYETATTKISHQYNSVSFVGYIKVYGNWGGISATSMSTDNRNTLIEVYYDKNITVLPTKAFYYCINLITVKLLGTTTSIPNDCFNNCSSLTNFEIPDSVTSIGSSAFNSCSKWSPSHIPEGITTLLADCFRGCKQIPDDVSLMSITNIASGAFSNSSTRHVTIGKNISSMREDALPFPSSTTDVGYHIIILKNNAPTLTLSTSSNSQIKSNKPVFVYSKYLRQYKTKTNWVARANYIYPVGGVYTETVTIPVSSWSNNSATIEVVGSTNETRNVVEFMLVDVDGNQIEDTYGLKAVQGTTQMTFTCNIVPTEDIYMFVKSTLTNYD